MQRPFWRALSAGFAQSAELVLAEVLNNVAEHAYADEPGDIELSLERREGSVAVRVADQGRSMPDRRLPLGEAPNPLDLPEGGFGWNLIRQLTDELCYRHHEGWNLLTFVLPELPER
jgi:serine/threonine-protein kinase RsbW